MIQATARVLRNVIEMEVGGETWTCRPVSGSEAPSRISQRIALLFSTTYEILKAADGGKVHSTVSYQPKKDEILIQVGEQKWRTKSSVFGPITFEYGGLEYSVSEKLTGRFGILRGELLVATGELGFRSCALRDYPPELEGFLANLVLGYLIRNLWWEMFR
jgi:hypothetical protein